MKRLGQDDNFDDIDASELKFDNPIMNPEETVRPPRRSAMSALTTALC